MKTRERELARRLRREEGLSVKEIERRLGVSRSSVSVWVRDVRLTPEQRERLRRTDPAHDGHAAAAAARRATFRARRAAAQERGRALAREPDALFAAGCMLFWAEGSKRRDAVILVNSDPEMLRFFVWFLRRYFDVPDEKFRVSCNLFADHAARQHEVEAHWLDVLGLPRGCLLKSTVNRYSPHSKRKRLNMLPFGTCRVAVNSVEIAQQIYGAIQEYGGFERPEWLG
ncbi:MAG TPA: helix-turn-helix domain-containing protein [Gaiellaceae bacterium]|nr:helix-turn-helix domain-containing protein [Gaiellaceae bacterium]